MIYTRSTPDKHIHFDLEIGLKSPSHQPVRLRTLDGHRGRTAALITLSSKDLIIMRAELLSILGPSIEMILDRNRTTNALALSHRPELLECSSSIDRRLVGSGSLQNVVCASVRGDGALLLSSRSGVVAAVGLDDVVLDQRVACPAVERDVGVDACSVPGTGVGDDALTAGVPAFAGDKVTDVGPLYVVLKGSQYVIPLW